MTDSPAAETPNDLFARMTAGWRGPGLAALMVLFSALPALLALPPLDRDESRFAEATAQMLETRDFVSIHFQEEARDKKPVGIYWLQAVTVGALSNPAQRAIWAYRLPSLLAGMIAAAACVVGATGFWGRRAGFVAGALLGGSLILSSEAFIAKTDAVLCASVTVAMAALSVLYRDRSLALPRRRWGTKLAFWLGIAVSVLVKGPIGPMVAGLAMAGLWAADRDGAWLKRIGWLWGLLILLLVVGPWALAITVATDGGFWTTAVKGDLAPKLAGGHESHGAPPGLHLLLSPILFFPGAALLPPALTAAWIKRRETGVRFALAWLIPSWIVFEATPTKLVHYTLPLFGALAWLAAAATDQGEEGWGPRARRGGAVLSVLASLLLAAVCIVGAQRYGGAVSLGVLAATLALAAGICGAVFVLRGRSPLLLVATLLLGVLCHAAITGLVAPGLQALWVSDRAAALVKARDLDPRNGVTPGPVSVTGYAEPSLVFALGTQTELGDPDDAADAIMEGRPALVEDKKLAAFLAALKVEGGRARPVGRIAGYDYSIGKPIGLSLFRGEDIVDKGEH